MINFAGQDISNGDFIAQIARTNQGIVRRVGVVLDSHQADDEGIKLRVVWYDPEEANVQVSESSVSIDNLVKIDPATLPWTTVTPLTYAKVRGRAAL